MVQTANVREDNDIAGRGKLYGTRTRALLAERKMRSVVMMVLKIARQNAAQMALVEDDAWSGSELAALRHFNPLNIRFGSKAADMIGAMQRPMSALPPKADK